MKGKKFFRIAAVLLILAGMLLLTKTAAPALADESPETAQYFVEPGTASGTGYTLTGGVWQITGQTSGGIYRLSAPASPALRGNGCCCSWLPCIFKNR